MLRQYINIAILILSATFLLWMYKALQDSLKHWTSPEVTLLLSTPQKNDSVRMDKLLDASSSLGRASSFVTVNQTKTLLISAYLEHRTEEKEVRVISVVLRSQAVAYICIFLCQGLRYISEGVSHINNDHFGFPYGTADIMCPLPLGCQTPSHIAVTTVVPKDEDELDFLEIQNQNPKSDSFPYNFTVCLSTMYDFTNVLQLVQSLEMFQLLGVNKVVVYKTNCSAETQLILDYYTHKGLLEVIPWSLSRFIKVSRNWSPEHGPGELHYFGQIPALTDCLYRCMYRSKYVAMQDIDELILPQSVNSWLELLPLLETKYGLDKCYEFENNAFPKHISLPPPAPQTLPPQGCWENIPGVNILAHLYQEPASPQSWFENYKFIVSPRAVFTPTVHRVLSPEGICTVVDRNIARLYHTRVQSAVGLTPDQLIYDGRLLSYSAPLVPAVNTVLKESGILPKNSIC
ncbi:uncharacterized protein LOC121646233 [Melanotaenia boesemani]|uniref:uncharacterized protein LOC121646233 n=1 Tax=Melanotaenia boesemani TaxID=1250792 RepID=UPI001C04260A|nr:uncharacterized protein LOC121646233 [Melanotaenia boesemani]XP_041851070.1 uncharacterized protein LOC121646233 [Melanotaenia boesemani]